VQVKVPGRQSVLANDDDVELGSEESVAVIQKSAIDAKGANNANLCSPGRDLASCLCPLSTKHALL